MTRDLLLEIGTEEIPARFMPEAHRQLAPVAAAVLEGLGLAHGQARAFTTPRRLAVLVDEVPGEAQDLVNEVKGPPIKAAFDDQGQPTRAATGFAHGQGVAVEDLEQRELAGGHYVVAVRREKGKTLRELAPQIVSGLVHGLSFPVAMRWGQGDFAFVRPIRWLLLLWGEEALPATVAGVEAGQYSRGHRYLGENPVYIARPAEYREKLRSSYALVEPEERRQLISSRADELVREAGGEVQWDQDLLTEVVNLVEYPTPFLGSFDEEYLQLPPEVVATPMKEHQRYFPVQDAEGRLLPYFVGVRNGDDRGLDVVRAGNEKVLQARLADARFFFREDREEPLSRKVPRLQDVVFIKNLGTMHDKIERLQALTGQLARNMQLGEEPLQWVQRAAFLCKADLITQMVFEFDELQGYMGRQYALLDGEPEPVALAIYEHYLPRQAGDDLPRSRLGQLLSLADKMDSIVGCFSQGIVPSGSADPYALRRQGNGVVRLLVEDEAPPLDLEHLIESSLGVWAEGGWIQPEMRPEVLNMVQEFFQGRVRAVMEERGFAWDLVEAAMARGYSDVHDLRQRLEALRLARAQPWFADLLTAYQRVHNLAGKLEGSGAVEEKHLEEEAERELFAAWMRVRSEAVEALAQGRYQEAMAMMGSSLRAAVDRFFDEVLVMAPEEVLRQNRLALLQQLDNLFTRVGDLSLLSGEPNRLSQ